MVNYFQSFIQLIEERSDLFTEEDRNSLRQQQWSNDRDDMEDEIVTWAKPRTSIYQALTDFANHSSRLPGDGKAAPPVKEEEYPSLLKNAIHRCFSESEDKSNSRAK